MISASISEILALATEGSQQRDLTPHTARAYTRIWRKVLALCAAEGHQLATLPKDKAVEYYGFLTRNRGASHHIQTKAALAFLCRVLDCPNPFKECLAPKFSPDKIEIQYLPAADLAKVLLHLGQHKSDYFSHLTAYLAEALFYTATRFHEWTHMERDKLERKEDGSVASVRLRVKGGKFRDMPLVPRLGQSLGEWLRFLESFKGHRLRQGGVEFAGSELVFPGQGGGAVDNAAFNRRLAAACRAVGVRRISAHGLRHSAATLLINQKGRNLKEIQELLGHKSLSTTARYTHIDHERLRSVVADISV